MTVIADIFLPVCEVARLLEKETGEFWIKWLHLMSKSHLSSNDLFKNKGGMEFTHTVNEIIGILAKEDYLEYLRQIGEDDYGCPVENLGSWASEPGEGQYFVPTHYRVSVLDSLKRVVVYQDRFRQWHKNNENASATFWFGKKREIPIPSALNASEQSHAMNQKKHEKVDGPKAQKMARVAEQIVESIRTMGHEGTNWHQSALVNTAATREGLTKSSLSRLVCMQLNMLVSEGHIQFKPKAGRKPKS